LQDDVRPVAVANGLYGPAVLPMVLETVVRERHCPRGDPSLQPCLRCNRQDHARQIVRRGEAVTDEQQPRDWNVTATVRASDCETDSQRRRGCRYACEPVHQRSIALRQPPLGDL
jgi:hypothetical protein